MSPRRVVVRTVEAVLLVFGLVLVAGQLLGQPVLLGFVETGSMEPTLAPGDGFVAIPSALTTVERGDVIVFRAQEVQGGGLTTHRVVGETERGYVTKGDANPFTDQNGGEPPVKRTQVVAEAWQAGGTVVVVPSVGTVVTGTQTVLQTLQRYLAVVLGTDAVLGVRGLAYLVFAASLAWYAVGAFRDDGRTRDRDRSREEPIDGRLLAAGFAALLVVGATAAMVGPAGPQTFGVVSAEFDSDRPNVIPAGESTTRTLVVPNDGWVPVVVVLEPASDQIGVDSRRVSVPARSVQNVTVTLHAPPKTGFYRRVLVQHRYLAVLPAPTTDALHRVHPWLPILVIDAVIGVPFYLLATRLLATGRVRTRSRDRPDSTWLPGELRRLVRWLL